MRILLVLLPLCLLFSPSTQAQKASSAAPAVQHYVYVLQPIPRLRTVEAWTEADNQIVAEHFQRLQRLTEAGTVLMAGRTPGLSEDDFGLVFFQATSPEEAETFMKADPAVRDGIMTARLHPFGIALLQQFDAEPSD